MRAVIQIRLSDSRNQQYDGTYVRPFPHACKTRRPARWQPFPETVLSADHVIRLRLLALPGSLQGPREHLRVSTVWSCCLLILFKAIPLKL